MQFDFGDILWAVPMRATISNKLKMLGVEDLRNTNEGRMLHLIRHRQPISRIELARATGLGPGTVSIVVNRLLSAGFLSEGEAAPSSGGRRAQYIQMNAEKAYAVALSIGVRQTAYAISDFNGRVLSQRVKPTEKNATKFLQDLGKEIHAHLETVYPHARFAAVGVAIPGLINHPEGKLILSPNHGWKDVPIRQILEKKLHLPVYVENDANAAALAELWYGPLPASGNQSILFVLVVEGIGTGLVLGDELYLGTRFGIGGFGHMHMDPRGPRCSCGNIGCWEAMASDEATLARFRKAKPLRSHEVRSMQDLIGLAQVGDPDARRELLTTADLLGKGIRGLAQGLAPEAIVIGGEITAAWPMIEPQLKAALQSRYFVTGVSMPIIRPASVERPTLYGAIPLALLNVLRSTRKA
jgi:predicted NBD/HSP70 family sugar kinase